MSGTEERLDRAVRVSIVQRARLKAGAEALRARLTPSRLVGDGKAHLTAQAKSVAADGTAHLRAHPVLTAVAGTGLLAWIFRKPILRHGPPLWRNGYDWLAGKAPFSQFMPDRDQSEDQVQESPDDNGDGVQDFPEDTPQ